MDQPNAKPDDRKWCFLLREDSESAFGPYETREAAIKAAVDSFVGAGDTIVLSRGDFPDPGEELCQDAAGRLMEALEEDCNDDLRNPEDLTFTLNEGANLEDLDTLIRGWLRANVHATYFQVDGDVHETVKIGEQ